MYIFNKQSQSEISRSSHLTANINEYEPICHIFTVLTCLLPLEALPLDLFVAFQAGSSRCSAESRTPPRHQALELQPDGTMLARHC